MRTYYVLYSPEHINVIPEIKDKGGKVIVPERQFQIGARAIYRCKGLPDRRYRSDYPTPHNRYFTLAKFRSIKEAQEERKALHSYCVESFEIHEWCNGVLGKKVEDEDYDDTIAES